VTGRKARWLVLSDGARPTEDLYLLDPAAPALRAAGVDVARWPARRWRGPLAGLALRRMRGRHVLLCRSLPEPWLQRLAQHRAALGRLTYIIDDDIPAAAADERLPAAYRARMQRLAAQQPRILTLADEVVACSETLAQRLRPEHPAVSVLTPTLPAPLPPRTHLDTPPSLQAPWAIGFHGTRAHRADLAAIAPALARLLEQRRAVRLEIMLGRFTPPELAELPRVHTPAPLPWARFRRYQARRRLHIGLAPLLETPFNQAKSPIKFLDIAAMGGVGLYSRRRPYTEIVRDGEDGLLVDDDPEAWYEALAWLLDHPDRAREMAANAAHKAAAVGDPQRAAAFWQART